MCRIILSQYQPPQTPPRPPSAVLHPPHQSRTGLILWQNDSTHFLSEFISNNTETFRDILLHKTLFVRHHIKHYWYFRGDTTKQYYSHLSEFTSHITFSGSYYKAILHIFSELISNNIDTFRVTAKPEVEIWFLWLLIFGADKNLITVHPL